MLHCQSPTGKLSCSKKSLARGHWSYTPTRNERVTVFWGPLIQDPTEVLPRKSAFFGTEDTEDY